MKSFAAATAILALIPAALAQPLTARDATTPKFYIQSSSETAEYNDLILSSYHTGAGEGFAVLVNPTTPFTAIEWNLNGTAAEIAAHETTAMFLTESNIPFGLVVPAAAAPWEINDGLGTKGFFVAGQEDFYFKLQNGIQFYSCANDTLGGAKQVFLSATGNTPHLCEVVELRAHYNIDE